MQINRLAAKHELWRRGNLNWKCHRIQKQMYDLFYKSEDNSILVWLLARQSGKSYLLAILALEAALREPNSIIKLVTDTKLHVRSIFEPIFTEILADCPEDISPKYNGAQFYYYFPNGSQIQLAGSDNKHYEKLRGQKSTLVLVDEAGFCNDLDSMVISVLLPTTTHTGGKIVLATTPPEELDHDFFKFMEEADLNKRLVTKTIYDNPLLSQDQIQNIIKKMGGVNNPRFRREYMCELIKDATTSVIPEFTEELEREIVREWPKPQFYDCYVSMDLGGKDLTVVLFGYYDFRADKLIIEHELVMDFQKPNNTLEKLTQEITRIEESLWLNLLTNEVKTPQARISDIDYIAINEIRKYSLNKINFTVSKKDDNDSAINNMRVMIGSKKIIINPSCVTLIRHLKNVKWRSSMNKSVFGRSPDNGHYDAVEALKYLVRNIQYTKNPYPAHFDYNTKDLYIQNKDGFSGNKQFDAYRKIFGMKTRK